MFLQRSDDNTGKIEGIVDEKLAMSGFVNEEQVTEMIAAAQLEPVVPDVYLTKNEAASTYSTTGHSHSSFNNRLSTTGLDAKNGITSFTFGNDYLGINTYHDTMGGVFVDQYERDGKTRRNRVTIINGYGDSEFPGNTTVLKNFTAKQNVNIYGDLYVKGVKIDGSGGGEFDPSVLEPYATIQYVDSEIAKIPSGGGGGEVTKAYVDEQISTHNHNNVYYTKTEVDTKIAEIPSGGGGGSGEFAAKNHRHDENIYEQYYSTWTESTSVKEFSVSWYTYAANERYIATITLNDAETMTELQIITEDGITINFTYGDFITGPITVEGTDITITEIAYKNIEYDGSISHKIKSIRVGPFTKRIFRYATIDEVERKTSGFNSRINELDERIDHYYTKSYINEKYYTKTEVDTKIAEIPSGGGGEFDPSILEPYATKTYVDTKIAEIPSGGGGGGVDPSQFALKDHTHTYIGNDIRVDGNITMKTGETKSWDLAFDWLTVATIPRQMVRDVKDSNIITLGTRQQYKVERGDRLKASFTFDNLSTTNTITIDYTFSNSEGGGVKTTIYENVLWTGDGVGYTMTFDNLPYNSDGKIYVTCSQLEIYREKTTENITTLVSANGDVTLPGSLTATNKYHQMGNLSIDEDVFRFFNADMEDQDKCYFEIGKGLNKTTGNEGFWITYTFPGITELGFQGAIDMMKFTYDGRKIDINGDLTVAGEININKIKASNVTVNGGALYFLNMNTGDWVGRIAECSIVGGSKEVIHLMVEHYEHRMTLLDENGDTTLPGSLTVSGDLNVPNIATVGSLMMSNEDSGRNVRLYCSDVGIGVYDSKKGKYYTLWNANNVSETITHTTNVTGEIGTFCETNGGIYDGYDNITETDCICQVVQSSTLNNRIVGVITSPNQFASHGDVLMKVVPGTYKLGDILAPDITGRARVATDTELQYMVIHAIPRPKITSLATGIENTVACFIV